jgi:hypothetical protein
MWISVTSTVTAKMSQTGEQAGPWRVREVPMKRLFILSAVVIMLAVLFVSPAAAAGPTVASGGGRGTVDGTNPFSQFGFAVTRAADGAVQGNFNCLMAGASEFPGFDLMAVRGQIRTVAVSGNTATFEGAGMFQTGNQGKEPATFRVVVTAGGPGVGILHLTLLTPFVFDLPPETVLNGNITIY